MRDEQRDQAEIVAVTKVRQEAMTKTSIGLQELRKRLSDKAKAEKSHRFWGVYTHIWKMDVLKEAYRLAKKNKGAPGIDKVSFDQIEEQGLEKFLLQISQELQERTYQPLPCRRVEIPKSNGKVRGLNIPAIRDRVVQGALKLIMEPVFEADFQPGSFGYRPNKSPHEALERTSEGLGKYLRHVIDLDLKSYFDTVRHDILLKKIAARFNDDDVMWLCKKILKSSGSKGVAQGSVIGPLWANLYLNDVDRMLEQAQTVTRDGKYERVRYVRFADDLIVLISDQPFARHWQWKVEKRLREELAKLGLTINEEKSKVVKFSMGASFDFLGYTFRCCPDRTNPKQGVIIGRPQRQRRIAFLKEIRSVLDRSLHIPVEKVVKEILNPRIRGWVNYFRWRNAGDDLSIVRSEIERKVFKFALRQRPKRRRGRTWITWSNETIYDSWGLYSDYSTIPHYSVSGKG